MLNILKNFWFYQAVLGCVLVVALKFLRRYLYATKKWRLPLLVDAGVMVVFTVAFGALLFFESCNGIVQFFLDYFISEQDSPAWAVIFMPITIMVATALYGYLLTQVSAWGVRLVKRCNRYVRRREERAARARYNQHTKKRQGTIPDIEVINLDTEEGERRLGLDISAIIANMGNYAEQREREERTAKEAEINAKNAEENARREAIRSEQDEAKAKRAAAMKEADKRRNDEKEAKAQHREKRKQFERPLTEMEKDIFQEMLEDTLQGKSSAVARQVRAYFEAEAGAKLQALSPDYVLSVRVNASDLVQVNFRSANPTERQKASAELAAKQAQWEKDHPQKPVEEDATANSSAQILQLHQPLVPAAQA